MQRNIFMDIIHITIKSNVHVLLSFRENLPVFLTQQWILSHLRKSFSRTFLRFASFFVNGTNIEQKVVLMTRQKLRTIFSYFSPFLMLELFENESYFSKLRLNENQNITFAMKKQYYGTYIHLKQAQLKLCYIILILKST